MFSTNIIRPVLGFLMNPPSSSSNRLSSNWPIILRKLACAIELTSVSDLNTKIMDIIAIKIEINPILVGTPSTNSIIKKRNMPMNAKKPM
jgi:hypothetical protein